MKTIFEFLDYKAYLEHWIESQPNRGHGTRARLAEAMGCHAAYLSQVLKGNAQLSLEQAWKLGGAFELAEEEFDFLLLLVERARAGTSSLEKYFDRKIKKVLEARSVIKNRIGDTKTLNLEDQAYYYSSWAVSAVHLLISTAKFDSVDKIREYLRLPKAKIQKIVAFLKDTGLAEMRDGKYLAGPVRLHLGSDSPLIQKHHTNWRIRAIESLENEDPMNLHYSSAVSLNRKDVDTIREALMRAIEDVRKTVKESTDEDCLYCYNFDLFEVAGK